MKGFIVTILVIASLFGAKYVGSLIYQDYQLNKANDKSSSENADFRSGFMDGCVGDGSQYIDTGLNAQRYCECFYNTSLEKYTISQLVKEVANYSEGNSVELNAVAETCVNQQLKYDQS